MPVFTVVRCVTSYSLIYHFCGFGYSSLVKETMDEGLIQQIPEIAQALHNDRSKQRSKKQWGITKLYNEYFHEPTSQFFKLHAKLDRLVMQAYGFNPDDDLLEDLLTLNLELAGKEKQGEAIACFPLRSKEANFPNVSGVFDGSRNLRWVCPDA